MENIDSLALGLLYGPALTSGCGEWGLPFVTGHGLLIPVTSPVAWNSAAGAHGF